MAKEQPREGVRAPTTPSRSPGDEAKPGAAQTGEVTCPKCQGSGRLQGEAGCPDCGGSGRVVKIIGDA